MKWPKPKKGDTIVVYDRGRLCERTVLSVGRKYITTGQEKFGIDDWYSPALMKQAYPDGRAYWEAMRLRRKQDAVFEAVKNRKTEITEDQCDAILGILGVCG